MAPSRPRFVAAVLAAALAPAGLLMVGTGAAEAADADLKTAASFALLAGSTITNTGSTVVTGDLGLSPGSSVTGFGPGVLLPPSAQHVADAVATQAKIDARTAYTRAAGLPVTETVPAELGGRTLGPGVYSGGALGLTGTLSLDAQGDPDAEFVLRASSTLTTASGSQVLLVNGASPCNVTWVVGSSATLGTSTTLVGTVLASTSITATTGATVQGRLLADTGAVTLDTNVITRPVCTTAVEPAPVPSASPTVAPSASASPTPTATPTGSPTPTAAPTPTGSAAPTASTAPTGSPAPAGPTPTAPTAPGTPTASATPVVPAQPGPPRAPYVPSSPGAPQLPRTGIDAATTAVWGTLLAVLGAGLALAGSAPALRRRRAAR